MSTISTPTTNTAVPSTLDCLLLVGRGVLIETIRRKEFYVLLIFMAIYMTGILIAGIVGIENEQTLVFLLNLGISFAYLSAHVLAILTAARQIPFEVDNRTIYPLLAKPLSRPNYILGKWGATTLAALLVFVVLFVMSYLPWLLFPGKPELSLATLAQGLVLNVASIGMVTAFAMLGSLIAPQGVNVTLCGLIFFGGSLVGRFLEARAALNGWGDIGKWLAAYIPDFGILNLFTRYTDGIGPVGGLEFLGLIAYGAIFTLAPFFAAAAIFDRRPL
jgi:ABC-type transport system involved in multi-copper enzyme maturation permease subunit